MRVRTAFLGALAAFLAGCVSFPDAPVATTKPAIVNDAAISVDGARLGLTRWDAPKPIAILVAVHGMNDYAGTWFYAGPYWAARNVSVYAYDQRGFGRSPEFGRWAGGAALKQDLRAVIAAVRAENPGLPLYVVGHSMGSGVIMAALKDAPLDVDGVILGAPGVWGGASMSIFYRAAISISAGFAPGKTLTGEGAGRQASDNIEFLHAMYLDPYVIKETRLDAVLGAVKIMGDAWDASDEIGGKILFLYGEKDEIIPLKAMRRAAARLCGDVETIVYPEDWHLLFGDLQREGVLDDVALWIAKDAENWRPRAQTGNPEAAVSNPADEGRSCGSARTSGKAVAATRPGAG